MYALISAFEDSRFSPITNEELESLHWGLSLLWNFTPISNPLDWEVGKHGIEIDFYHKGRPYSGTWGIIKKNYIITFLPEVAKEQMWNQRETLQYLVRKSGYYGKLDDVFDSINWKTYESLKFNMSYQEYKEYIKDL